MSGGVNPGALLPSTKKSWLLVFYVCVGGGGGSAHVLPQHMCGSHRTTCRRQLSLSGLAGKCLYLMSHLAGRLLTSYRSFNHFPCTFDISLFTLPTLLE